VDDEQLDHLRTDPRVSLVAYSPILKGTYDDPTKRAGHPSTADYAGPDADARLARLTGLTGELGGTPNQLWTPRSARWTSSSPMPSTVPFALSRVNAR